MIDAELLSDIDAITGATPALRTLEASKAEELRIRVGQLYVRDTDSLWWWANLKIPIRRVSYDQDDGVSHLIEIVGDAKELLLFITDDESPPWPVVSGDVASIGTLLREVRHFEYFITPTDLSWIAFDTHQNEIVTSRMATKSE